MNVSRIRSIALIVALPIFLHAHLLLGFFIPDPLITTANVGTPAAPMIAAQTTLDYSNGFVDQALTSRAAHMLLSGSMPWWNPYEGLGTELAGEMQSSALYPFALLAVLPGGSLALDILMQITSGIGMLLVLRKCECSAWAALCGALAYETTGTAAWLSGVWSYSLPWLPFLLLGIECLRGERRRDFLIGVLLVGLSIDALLYAGFIETSYIEGLLGIAWMLVRFFYARTISPWIFARRLSTAFLIGLAVGLPIIVSFADMLAVSVVGIHDGVGAWTARSDPLTTLGLLQKFVPYAYGPLFASRQPALPYLWITTGGYLGISAVVLALFSLFGKRLRPLRFMLLGAAIVSIGSIIGVPLVQHVVLLIPGIRYAEYYRYADPVAEFAIIFLAALAIDDMLASSRGYAAKVVVAIACFLTIAAFALAPAWGELSSDPVAIGWRTFSLVTIASCLCASAISCAFRSGRVRASIVGITMVVELSAYLVIPTLSYPPHATYSRAGIAFLAENLGNQRVYSFNRLAPNYGSYFGFSQLDFNDSPTLAKQHDYLLRHLVTAADDVTFDGIYTPPGAPAPITEFERRTSAYGDVGVKYIVGAPGSFLPSDAYSRVFEDSVLEIDQLRHVAPYFSAGSCKLTPSSRTLLSATCAAPTTLCRLEIDVPGWTATIDGKAAPLHECADGFQAVDLPAGTATVEFSFLPPHEQLALLIAVLGIGVYCWFATRLRTVGHTG